MLNMFVSGEDYYAWMPRACSCLSAIAPALRLGPRWTGKNSVVAINGSYAALQTQAVFAILSVS
jgi:hypothetical protein